MEWVPTTWQTEASLTGHELGPIEIVRTVSPFYIGERYAVRRGGNVLATYGKWEPEPIPSSRTVEFYRWFRFMNFESAKKAAEAAIE